MEKRLPTAFRCVLHITPVFFLRGRVVEGFWCTSLNRYSYPYHRNLRRLSSERVTGESFLNHDKEFDTFFRCEDTMLNDSEVDLVSASTGEQLSTMPSPATCTNDRPFSKRSISWEDAVDIILSNRLDLLARNRKQEEEYSVYRDTLKQTWVSAADYVLHSKFDFPKEKTTVSYGKCSGEHLWTVTRPLEVLDVAITRLCLNDFPYNFENGVEHWCLWKFGGEANCEDVKSAVAALHGMIGTVTGAMHWVNPPHLKSLPEIDHVHIICKRDNDFGNVTRPTCSG